MNYPDKGEDKTSSPLVQISFSAQPLTLKDFLDLAVQNHPDLAIARARVQAARGKLLQEGLYPNPLITPNIQNVGDNRNAWGKPGVTIQQELVTAHKLKIARAGAEQGVQAADWEAMTRYFEVVTRVRRAYTDLLTAQREEKTTRDILQVAKASVEAANKLLQAGVGSRPDVLRAETELEQAVVRNTIAQRRVQAARQLLAAAAGISAFPNAEIAGTLDQPVPNYDWHSLQAQVLAQSSEVQSAQARFLQAQQLLKRAEVEKVPNLLVMANPFHEVPTSDTQVTVGVGASLPVFNRNQGNILAAQAQLLQAQAEVKKTELSLSERLTVAFQQYQVAHEQVEAYRTRIVPKARESLELVNAGYKKGDPKYDYTALLQAQQILFQAELNQVQALGELWRAVADLEGLLQRPEDF